MIHRSLVLSVPLLLAAVATTQKPSLEWQRRSTTIDYGSLPVGAHSLAELPIGQSWRLGANQQTVWRTQLPIIAGDKMLAPGEYVITLNRSGEAAAAIVAGSAAKGLGGSGEFRIDGQLGKADKPGKKLVIEMAKAGAAVHGNQPAHCVVQFGADEWKGAFTMPGSKTVTAGGWKVTTFSLPAACVAGRDKTPVPVATVTKNDKDCWNLVLGANEAKLVPWPEPEPQTMPGAPPPKPKTDGLPTTTGKVGVQQQKDVDPTVLDPKLVAEKPTIELLLARSSPGILTVEFLCGTEWFRLSMVEPKVKAGK